MWRHPASARWGAGLLDLLLPPACAGCGRATDLPLCDPCRRALAWIPTLACASCQMRAPLPGADCCGRCAPRPSPLDACTAACWFEDVAASWVRDYKYAEGGPAKAGVDRARMRALALALCERAPAEEPEWVIPIPLHRRRLRTRGFNPACGVARVIARERSLRLAPVALQRVRDTPSQTRLDRRRRGRNVRGAFRAPRPVPAHVWLVDDVVTTGATLEAAARALRRAGARRIVALCLARTPTEEGSQSLGSALAAPPLPTDSAITSRSRAVSTGFLKITPSRPSTRLRLMT